MISEAIRLHRRTLYILVAKMVLLLALTWFIYNRVWVQQVETGYVQHLFNTMSRGNSVWLIACLLLVPVNWMLEVKKWKMLTTSFNTLNWRQASQSILAGITLGVLTPARLGEYGGRLLHSRKGHRVSTLYAHFISSISQNIPVFLFGAIGVFWFFSKYYFASAYLAGSIATVLLVFTACMILVYIQHQPLAAWIAKKQWLSVFSKAQGEVRYREEVLNHVVVLSLIRYLIFATQFLSLLFFAGIPVGITEALMGIFVIFVFQTGLPLPPILGVVARSQLSVIVWSVFSKDQISMLAVPVVLYTINLLIPSLLGGWVLLTSRFQNQVEYD